MKCHIVFISALLVAVASVPILRQLDISSDVYVLTVNGTQMCQVDERLYQTGEDLPTEDPCEYCTCEPPGFACQVVKCEHKPECRALQRSGLCCPEYICDCEFKGKIYQNGERITDNDNKCEDCYCVTGEVTCSVIQCAAPPDNCELIPAVERCCPTFNCSDGSDDQGVEEYLLENSTLENVEEIIEIERVTETVKIENDDIFEASPIEGALEESDAIFETQELTTEIDPVPSNGEGEYWLSLLTEGSGFENQNKIDPVTVSVSMKEMATEPSIVLFEDRENIVMVESATAANFIELTTNFNVETAEVDGSEKELEAFKRTEESVESVTDISDSKLIEEITYSASFKDEEIIETRTESQSGINFLNADNAEFDTTDGSVDELSMLTVQPIVDPEVGKTSKIDFIVGEVLKSQYIDSESVDETTKLVETGIESVNELEPINTAKYDLDATERSVLELNLPIVPNADNSNLSESDNEYSDSTDVTTEGAKSATASFREHEFTGNNNDEFDVTERSVDDLNATVDDSPNVEEVMQFQNENTETPSAVTEKTEEIIYMEEIEHSHVANLGLELTERSAEEIATTISPLRREEVVEKIAKIQFNAELSPANFEGLDSMPDVAEETETKIEMQNELDSFDEENVEFEVTERSADELSISTILPEHNTDITNKITKNTASVVAVKSQELTPESVEEITETDETIVENFTQSESLEFDATERSIDEFSITTMQSVQEHELVNKIAKIKFSLEELTQFQNGGLDSADTATEVVETRIKSFDGIELPNEKQAEFEVTESTTDDLRTKYSLTDELEINESASATTEQIETRIESFDELMTQDATEMPISEDLEKSTDASLNKLEVVNKIAKINLNFDELLRDEDINSQLMEVTTEVMDNEVELADDKQTDSVVGNLDEIDNEILEFGIQDVRGEEELIATTENTLMKSEGNAQNITYDEEVTASTTTLLEEEAAKTNVDESEVNDSSVYFSNADNVDELSIQNNDIIEENDDTEATTPAEEAESETRNETPTLLESSEKESVTEAIFKTDDKIKETFAEEGNKTALEIDAATPKKQRNELREHLSKKFGLRPLTLTRRTFSNDIEERRKTRLRDRKMIINKNRHTFH